MDKPFPKINMFTHLMPDKYRKALYRKAQRNIYTEDLESHHDGQRTLYDMDSRFKLLEKYEGFREVITLLTPPVEMIAPPQDAMDLAMLGNDEVAELVARYPEHFVAGVASLPMNDMDNALKEAQRAVEKLGMKGIQLYTPCYEKPLDSHEFFPLYEMMMKYDLPIWIHPLREANMPEYKGETASKYRIYQTVGWPYETTVAAVRIVFGGVLEKYPSLKFIIHHCGGMVPFFAGRLAGVGTQLLMDHAGVVINLSQPTIDYFHMFYADTALSGYSTPSLMAGYAFFGADHMVFATDLMFAVDKKVNSTDQMIIPDPDMYKICEGNALKLLHLK